MAHTLLVDSLPLCSGEPGTLEDLFHKLTDASSPASERLAQIEQRFSAGGQRIILKPGSAVTLWDTEADRALLAGKIPQHADLLRFETAVALDHGMADVPSDWIVFSSTRPLLGHRTQENADFLRGRFRAAVDPSDGELAERYMIENRKLAANVVVTGSREELLAMALLGSRYREKYLETYQGEELWDAVSSQVNDLSKFSLGELLHRRQVLQSGERALLDAVRANLAGEVTAIEQADAVPAEVPAPTEASPAGEVAERAMHLIQLAVAELSANLQVQADMAGLSPEDMIDRFEDSPTPNAMQPAAPVDLPLGSVRTLPFGEQAERYVEVLVELPVAELVMSEPEDMIRQHPTFARYVEMARAGHEPPPISVAVSDDGKLVSRNRRRVLAAQEAGLQTIKAWASPLNPETGLPLKYGELKGSIEAALAAGIAAAAQRQDDPASELPEEVVADSATSAEPAVNPVIVTFGAGQTAESAVIRDSEAWMRRNIPHEQIDGEGVGFIMLDEGDLKTERNAIFGSSVSGRMPIQKVVYRMNDGRLTYWDLESRSFIAVAQDDLRLKLNDEQAEQAQASTSPVDSQVAEPEPDLPPAEAAADDLEAVINKALDANSTLVAQANPGINTLDNFKLVFREALESAYVSTLVEQNKVDDLTQALETALAAEAVDRAARAFIQRNHSAPEEAESVAQGAEAEPLTSQAGEGQEPWRASILKARRFAGELGLPWKGRTLSALIASIEQYQNPPAMTEGMKLGEGDVVLTVTGRRTTPFPAIKTGSVRTANKTEKAVDAWLMQNALAEAEARGDEFNAQSFRAALDNPQQADKDSAEMYLTDPATIFPAQRPFLKPLLPEGADRPAPAAALVRQVRMNGDVVMVPPAAQEHRRIAAQLLDRSVSSISLRQQLELHSQLYAAARQLRELGWSDDQIGANAYNDTVEHYLEQVREGIITGQFGLPDDVLQSTASPTQSEQPEKEIAAVQPAEAAGREDEPSAGAPAEQAFSAEELARMILVSADNIDQLRRIDVFRVLDQTKSADQLRALGGYIAERRRDLLPEVQEVSKEIADERGWDQSQEVAPSVAASTGSEQTAKVSMPEWTEVNGEKVLRVGQSRYVGVPLSGRERSARFNILDLAAGEYVDELNGSEVHSWLLRAAQIEVEEAGLRAAADSGDGATPLAAAAIPEVESQQLANDFALRRTEVVEELIARGVAQDLYKAAGVRSADAFSNLPISEQAAAYVILVEQGHKPVEFVEDYNAMVRRQEHEATVRRMQSERTIAQANGKPFKTEDSARRMHAQYELGMTHEVVSEDGGYVLRLLSPAAQQELRNKAAGIESYTEAQSAILIEMGIGEMPEGEIDATEEQWAEIERRTENRLRAQRGLPPLPQPEAVAPAGPGEQPLPVDEIVRLHAQDGWRGHLFKLRVLARPLIDHGHLDHGQAMAVWTNEADLSALIEGVVDRQAQQEEGPYDYEGRRKAIQAALAELGWQGDYYPAKGDAVIAFETVLPEDTWKSVQPVGMNLKVIKGSGAMTAVVLADEVAKSPAQLAAELDAAATTAQTLMTVQAVQGRAASAVPSARYAGPRDVASVGGQKELANRGATIASLKMMNEQLRQLAPSEAWDDRAIEEAADLDALRDSISRTLVNLSRGALPPSAAPAPADPLRKRLEEASGADLRQVFDDLKLAGARMTHTERVKALMQEDRQQVEAALDAVLGVSATEADSPKQASGQSAQFGNYMDFIRDPKTPLSDLNGGGLLEHIEADERLKDDEVEPLIAALEEVIQRRTPVEAYEEEYSKRERRAEKLGRDKAVEEARSSLASMVLGRELGETLEEFFAKNPAIKARSDAIKAWLNEVPAVRPMTEAKVLYLAVSAEEWEQILLDGVIGNEKVIHEQGRQDSVFFADDIKSKRTAQGQNLYRRAKALVWQEGHESALREASNKVVQADLDLNERALQLGYDSLDDVPQEVLESDPRLMELQAKREQLLDDQELLRRDGEILIEDRARVLDAEDAARGYGAVMLETRPLAGGNVYTGSDAMNDEAGYGFPSGFVTLADIARIHFVDNATIVGSEELTLPAAAPTDAAEPEDAKWFGTQEKADNYIAKKGLADTHEVVLNDRRFEILPRAAAETAPLTRSQSARRTLDALRNLLREAADPAEKTEIREAMKRVLPTAAQADIGGDSPSRLAPTLKGGVEAEVEEDALEPIDPPHQPELQVGTAEATSEVLAAAQAQESMPADTSLAEQAVTLTEAANQRYLDWDWERKQAAARYAELKHDEPYDPEPPLLPNTFSLTKAAEYLAVAWPELVGKLGKAGVERALKEAAETGALDYAGIKKLKGLEYKSEAAPSGIGRRDMAYQTFHRESVDAFAAHLLLAPAASELVSQHQASVLVGGSNLSISLNKALIETSLAELDEVVRSQGLAGHHEHTLHAFRHEHAKLVEESLKQRIAVPDEVLADYPGLVRGDLSASLQDQMIDDLREKQGAELARAMREWQPGVTAGKELKALPTFGSLEDARAWVLARRTLLGLDSHTYSTSDEYVNLKGQIAALSHAANARTPERFAELMEQVDTAIGDRVSMVVPLPAGGEQAFEGEVISKAGKPFVKLDDPMPVTKGNGIGTVSEIPWDSRWIKVGGAGAGARQSVAHEAPAAERVDSTSELWRALHARWNAQVSGSFVCGKEFPAVLNVNGSERRFALWKDSGAGPLKFKTLSESPQGKRFDLFKLSRDGEIDLVGSKNLWALTEEAQAEHLAEFEAVFMPKPVPAVVVEQRLEPAPAPEVELPSLAEAEADWESAADEWQQSSLFGAMDEGQPSFAPSIRVGGR